MYLCFPSASESFLSSSPKLPNNETVLIDMVNYVSRSARKINILYFLRSFDVFERNSEECTYVVVNCMRNVMAYCVYTVFQKNVLGNKVNTIKHKRMSLFMRYKLHYFYLHCFKSHIFPTKTHIITFIEDEAMILK